MPTGLPRPLPTIWQGVRLAYLLTAFHWYGRARRAAAQRMVRIGVDRGHARWERAARRWLACSAKITAILGEPEPPEVLRLRETIEGRPPDTPGT